MGRRGNPTGLLPWLRSWSPAAAGADALAGLTVAAVLVPGAMAYAHVAGLGAEIGLYAATIPVLLYGLVGLVPTMSVGPIASVALLVGIAIGRAGLTDAAEAAQVAALLALACAVVLGAVVALRLDRLTARISPAALAGFVSGVGVLIVSTQVDSLIGLPDDTPHTLWGDLVEVVDDHEQGNWWTIGIAVVTVSGVMLLARFAPRVPAGLVAIVAGIAAESLLDLESHGVAVVGSLPAGLPTPSLPRLDGVTLSMIPVTFGIVVIALVEMSAIVRMWAERGGSADPHRETTALATVTASAGVFGTMPVTGSPSRATLAAGAGARTPFTALVTGLAVCVLLLVGTDWIEPLPVAVVASLVVVAGIRLIRPARLRALWRGDRTDGVIALVTLALSVLNIEAGVVAVVVISAVMARRGGRGGEPSPTGMEPVSGDRRT